MLGLVVLVRLTRHDENSALRDVVVSLELAREYKHKHKHNRDGIQGTMQVRWNGTRDRAQAAAASPDMCGLSRSLPDRLGTVAGPGKDAPGGGGESAGDGKEATGT